MEELKTKGKRGGARLGAGRPKGSTGKLTAEGILDTVYKKTGQDYIEILIDDFNSARINGDGALVNKYHNLILNKVATTLTSVDVNESEDTITAKRLAFAEALAGLVSKQDK
jgi:hypothetical protein